MSGPIEIELLALNELVRLVQAWATIEDISLEEAVKRLREMLVPVP